VYEIGGQAVFFWLGVGMVLLGMSIFFKVNARNK
jgi:heme exporter protein D